MKRRLWAVLLTGALAASAGLSCAGGRTGRLAPETLIIFPPPPDTARIQFLTRYSSAEDLGRRTSFWRSLVGEREDERAAGIKKPYGVAIHAGVIYVCDTSLPGVDVIDLERRTIENFMPRGDGQLQTPINCYVDPETGRLYITDTGRRQVVIFDSTLTYVDALEGNDAVQPTDIFAYDGRLWVTDHAGRQIRVYDKYTLEFVTAFPNSQAAGEEMLRQPTNLWIADDRVYVSDFGDFRVKMFTTDGTYLGAVGSYGRRFGQFARPKGIAVDRDGRLFVVDAAFENVQIFNPDGELLMFFGGPYQGPGNMWLPAKVIIDYDNLDYFEDLVDPRFDLQYLVFVTNQYGPDKLSVYGFVGPAAGGSDAQP
jgi:sugar lactone lactonase YvrE